MASATPRSDESGGLFASTRWTLVINAGDDEASTRVASDALAELCRIYWRPIYLFLRRQGRSSHDAQDLTQGFFAVLIDTRAYARADQSKGRFRSFVLGALKYFLADAYDFQSAQKRGGGAFVAPLNETTIAESDAESGYSERWNADQIYDREWAKALLQQTADRLAQECALGGRTALFEALKTHLPPGDDEAAPYEQLAARLHRPAATLRKDVERLRARYGAILREEVRGTVSDKAELDEELRYLCQVMKSG